MKINSAEFVTSVADFQKMPPPAVPEITVVGRSNVGKSSLINFLCAKNALARTSSTPGRTRLINLFDINKGEFLLVDLPGYGYQAGSKSDSKKWAALLEGYLEYRMNISCVMLLLDIRHAPSAQDVHMISYLNFLRIPFCVVATKTDEVPKSKVRSQMALLDKSAGVGVDNILPVSAREKTGRDAVLERLDLFLAASKQGAEQSDSP